MYLFCRRYYYFCLDQTIKDLNVLEKDVVVTDDNGEICGCFVYLNNTFDATLFWDAVLQRHRNIVETAATLHAGQLDKVFMSEQKVLTNLIKDKKYSRPLRSHVLPKDLFPSGLAYFNLHSHILNSSLYPKRTSHSSSSFSSASTLESNISDRDPVIIHNNFIIGRETKKSRFAK